MKALEIRNKYLNFFKKHGHGRSFLVRELIASVGYPFRAPRSVHSARGKSRCGARLFAEIILGFDFYPVFGKGFQRLAAVRNMYAPVRFGAPLPHADLRPFKLRALFIRRYIQRKRRLFVVRNASA